MKKAEQEIKQVKKLWDVKHFNAIPIEASNGINILYDQYINNRTVIIMMYPDSAEGVWYSLNCKERNPKIENSVHIGTATLATHPPSIFGQFKKEGFNRLTIWTESRKQSQTVLYDFDIITIDQSEDLEYTAYCCYRMPT